MNRALTRNVVGSALSELFAAADPSAVDRWFGPIFVQHSAYAADGIAGLRALAEGLPATFRYDWADVIVDGQLAVTHGIYRGYGSRPLTGFDVWRVAYGRIVEHWDSLSALVPSGGPCLLAGMTRTSDRDQSTPNRLLVEEFVRGVLVGGKYDELDRFVDSGLRLKRRGGDASLDGAGFPRLLDRDCGPRYTMLHLALAEGDLVYTRSKGVLRPIVLSDLWRVQGDRIVEHCGVVAQIPSGVTHSNGLF